MNEETKKLIQGELFAFAEGLSASANPHAIRFALRMYRRIVEIQNGCNVDVISPAEMNRVESVVNMWQTQINENLKYVMERRDQWD